MRSFKHIAHRACLAAALLVAFSSSVELGLCLCLDHVGTWTSAGMDACCEPGGGDGSTPVMQVAGPDACLGCTDLILPSLSMPVRTAPAPEALALPVVIASFAAGTAPLASTSPCPPTGSGVSTGLLPTHSGDLLRL